MTLLIALLPYALAQSDAEPVAPEVRYAQVTELEIEGSTVEGQIYRPGSQLVVEPPKPKHHSAIVLRKNFDDVTVESAEFVR